MGHAGTVDQTMPAGERGASSDRPRLLTYAGRWGRARRWLSPVARRVLDVGCAFGYGTVAMAGRGPARWCIVGLERDPELVHLAVRRYPWVPFVRGDASALPFASGSMDAVTVLDVVEHLEDPAVVFAEARRVLRPGGYLVASMPHTGMLAWLDANNVYTALRRLWGTLPPLGVADESATGIHRHFTLSELRAALGPGFEIDRVARTGLGVAELFHLLVLLIFKALLRWEGAYLAFRSLQIFTYLLEDLLPAGPLAYHLMVRARRAPSQSRTPLERLGAAGQHVRQGAP